MASTDEALVVIDGNVVAASSASVSVFDRGFLYGDSVFETLRTYGGRAFALDEHLDRLFESARRVLIQPGLDRESLGREIRDAVSRAGFAESTVRVMLTRGQARSFGLDPGLAGPSRRVVIVWPLEMPPPEKYEAGIAAVTYRTQRIADGTVAAGAKVANYLTAVLAIHDARARGADEALLVDAADRVLEGTTSNVFGVAGGRLITPPEELGILAGITRAKVIELARGLGIEVAVRPLGLDEIAGLDELFVTSTTRELLPVVRVDDQTIGAGRPGPVYARLLAAFRDAARASVGA